MGQKAFVSIFICLKLYVHAWILLGVMRMPKKLEKPMSFDELKEFFGRGNTWLYEQLQTGKLPGRKLGGKWIVYPSELQKYMDRLPSNQKKIRIAR